MSHIGKYLSKIILLEIYTFNLDTYFAKFQQQKSLTEIFFADIILLLYFYCFQSLASSKLWAI